MIAALVDMLSDKSVLTAITAVLVALGAKFGLQLDDATVLSFVGVFAAAILKHAAEAHGAVAAQTHADAIAPVKTPQSGRVRFDALGILATLAGGALVTLLAVRLLTGCATLHTMTGAFATCAETDLGQLVKSEAGQLVPLATDVAQLIDGNAAGLESALETLATTVGLDAIDCAVAAYDATHVPAATGSGSAVAMSAAVNPGLVRAKAWVVAQRSKR